MFIQININDKHSLDANSTSRFPLDWQALSYNSNWKFFKIRTIFGHSLTIFWFADLMNVTDEVTIHRPNVSTLLSSAFIRGDLNAATRGPFIC